jgi:hypothetical protein
MGRDPINILGWKPLLPRLYNIPPLVNRVTIVVGQAVPLEKLHVLVDF